MSEVVAGALGGDLVWVPNDAPVVPDAQVITSKQYTVVMSLFGFKLSRDFSVKIDESTNILYLE